MAKLRVLVTSSLLAGVVALAPPNPAGADAFLDPTFGTGGIVQQVLPTAPVPHGSVTDTLTTPDNKVLILGRANSTDPGPSQRAVVVRLTAAGTLDATFGTGGRVYLPDAFSRTDDGSALVRNLALDGSGRLVVTGASAAAAGGPRHTVVARLTSGGALDGTFGTDGIVRLPQNGGAPRGLVVDSQQRVVVAEEGPVPTVYRLTTDGALDAGFGAGGTVPLPPAGDRPTINPVDLALLPNDGVAYVGTAPAFQLTPYVAQIDATAVVRLTGSGTIQRVRLHRPGSDAGGGISTHAAAAAAVARADGTVVVGLSSVATGPTAEGRTFLPDSPWYGAFLLAEPPTDAPVTTVRVDGQPGSHATVRALALDSHGGVGVLFTAFGGREVAAFTPALTPDTGLSPTGRLSPPTFGDYNDVAADLAFDSQRRLVFAGIQRDQCCANWDFGAARLTTLDAPPSSPPTPPRNLQASFGPGRPVVTWEAPASNGGVPISGYRMDLRDADGNVQDIHFAASSRDWTLHVPYGAEYTVTLRAWSASHQGQSATIEQLVPLPISVAAFVDRTALEVRGAPLSAASRTSWIQQLTARSKTPFELVEALRRSADGTASVDPTARLYRASFNRIPDAAGLTYWIGRKRRGATLNAMASTFAASSEFRRLYGPSLTPRAFVTQVYRNVLGREPDASGITYWADQVASRRRTRGQVMVLISESAENIRRQAPAVDVQVAYLALLGRAPTPTEQADAIAALAAQPHTRLISRLMQDPAWTQRVTS